MKKVYGVLGMAAIAVMCALPTFATGPVQLSDTQMKATKGASISLINVQLISQSDFGNKNAIQINGDKNKVTTISTFKFVGFLIPNGG